MSTITVHFDREWKGDKIRADYEWEEEGNTYMIKEVPCEKLPFPPNKDYFSKEVSIAIRMIAHLQRNNEVPTKVNFMDIEELLPGLSDLDID